MSDKTDIRPNSREEAHDHRPTDAQDHAVTNEEKLDEGLMDSMDASDAQRDRAGRSWRSGAVFGLS